MRPQSVALSCLVSLALVPLACAKEATTDDPVTTTSTTTTTTSTGGSAGEGGTGGMGATGGTAGSGGNCAVPTSCDAAPTPHLLISEVATHPDAAEFIEIWNPAAQAVNLSNYYLSDNSAYYQITSGPWNPTQTAGTDFVARFPANLTIGPGERIVVQAGTDFATTFPSAPCPNTILSATPGTCGGNPVAAMVTPPNGSIGTTLGSLVSNDREMLMLFCWDGTADVVRDVDYVAWGTDDQAPWRSDKSAVACYEADTPMASQSTAPEYNIAGAGGLPMGQSIGRCDGNEDAETTTGGNGPGGHDETSEDLATTFSVLATASPGAANVCN